MKAKSRYAWFPMLGDNEQKSKELTSFHQRQKLLSVMYDEIWAFVTLLLDVLRKDIRPSKRTFRKLLSLFPVGSKTHLNDSLGRVWTSG